MRARRACAIASACAALLACTSTYDAAVTSPADVRAASRDVAASGSGRVHGEDGTMHDVDGDSSVSAESTGYEGTMQGLSADCAHARCPLDDPRATRWTITTAHRQPDVPAIAVGGLVIGFVGLNVACFPGDACATGVKTAVGITDAVIGAGVVAVFVALWIGFSNFRGD